MTGFMDDRRRALEEAFFHQKDQELLEKLTKHVALEERKKSLAAASGISDDKLLEKIAAMNVGAETLAALALAPLVEVAWADGALDDREREAIVRAAEEAGVLGGTPSWRLLNTWLKASPPQGLRSAWCDYVTALCQNVGPADRAQLKHDILGRARHVAEASGGFLGLVAKVSTAEQAVIAEMEKAFV